MKVDRETSSVSQDAKKVSYTAVVSTGIFCLSDCLTLQKSTEKYEFFNSTNEAILHGYRPCKYCSPLIVAGNTPANIKSIIDELNNNPGIVFKDYQLKEKGISSAQLRNWFKFFHGISFHSYQRMLRINRSISKLQREALNTSTHENVVPDSKLTFEEKSLSIFEELPLLDNSNSLAITRFSTPLGPVYGCASSLGVCLLEFTDRRMLETELKSLSKKYKAIVQYGENDHLKNLKIQLEEYFAGKRKIFSVPLDTRGTVFQESVWNELKEIPYGVIRTYKDLSISINSPGAVRAVANANGMNSIAILIPCHRIIGSDGHLTGYGGGLWRKKWLLNLENGVHEEVVAKGRYSFF